MKLFKYNIKLYSNQSYQGIEWETLLISTFFCKSSCGIQFGWILKETQGSRSSLKVKNLVQSISSPVKFPASLAKMRYDGTLDSLSMKFWVVIFLINPSVVTFASG